MPEIISSLVVTLGLDPSKFGPAADAAQKRIDKFDATVKKLTGSETELSDAQKATIDALRARVAQGDKSEQQAARMAERARRDDDAAKKRDDAAKQRDQAAVKRREEQTRHKDELAETRKEAERTKKELAAVDTTGKALWGTLAEVGVTFGAALGLTSVAASAGRAISSGAAIGRIAPNINLRPSELDAWVKAGASTGGTRAMLNIPFGTQHLRGRMSLFEGHHVAGTSGLRLPQPHPSPAPVFRDELHPGGF